MEIKDFNLKINQILINTNNLVVEISKKLEISVKNKKNTIILLEQSDDVKKQKEKLDHIKNNISILKYQVEEINVIKKALSESYVYINNLVKEKYTEQQLNRETDEIDLLSYELTINDIRNVVGEI